MNWSDYDLAWNYSTKKLNVIDCIKFFLQINYLLSVKMFYSFFSNSITYFIEKYQSRRYRRRGIAAGTAVVWPALDPLDALS